MKCSNCHAEWETAPSGKKLEFCPFCGHPLERIRKNSQEKDSFDFVWGSIYEDSFRKSGGKDASLFKQTIDSYLKALPGSMRKADTVADLLRDYPEQKLDEKQAAELEHLAETNQEDGLASALYIESFLSGNPAAASKLVFHQQEQIRNGNLTREDALNLMTEKLYQNPDFNPSIPQAAILNAWVSRLQNDRKHMLENLLKAFDIDEVTEESLYLLSSGELGRWLNLDGTLEGRRHSFEKHLKDEDLDGMLEDVLRPLYKEEGREYEHQNEQVSEMIPLIREHADEFENKLKAVIASESMLAGTHLALQQLKSLEPSLEPMAERLLKLHYEKVYMKPYSWVQKTDFKVSSRF